MFAAQGPTAPAARNLWTETEEEFKVSLGLFTLLELPGHVAQSVMCLATDACLTADPGIPSLIPARYHTIVEIDHEIISTVILLPSADSFKKGCCHLQAKVLHKLLVNRLFKPAQKKVWLVELTVRLAAMTIAVDFGRKARKQKKTNFLASVFCCYT